MNDREVSELSFSSLVLCIRWARVLGVSSVGDFFISIIIFLNIETPRFRLFSSGASAYPSSSRCACKYSAAA